MGTEIRIIFCEKISSHNYVATLNLSNPSYLRICVCVCVCVCVRERERFLIRFTVGMSIYEG